MPPALDSRAEGLRNALVDQLVADGAATNAHTEAAMRAIPREVFLPDVPLGEAYANATVTIKPDPAGGRPLSLSSVPDVVAMQLDQLDVQPGDRVLEVGAGSGVNAAYLAHLAGPTGHVATIDVHPDVTAHARKALDNAGYTGVEVITGDGAQGDPQGRTWDKIIVTVGAYDVPTALRDQLAPKGTLVIPLRFRATTRSLALHHNGTDLVSSSIRLCGFIPMIGQDTEAEATLDPGGHVTLYWDTDQAISAEALTGAVDTPRVAHWTSTVLGGNESTDGIWLWLAATEPGTCRINADQAAVRTGIANPAIPALSPALVGGNSLAYLAFCPAPSGFRLGAYAHGPQAEQLARQLCAAIGEWSHQRDVEPVFTVSPADAAHHTSDGKHVIRKAENHITVTYRAAS